MPARRSGRSRVQVCVDCTLSLLGRQTTRDTMARTMLVAGASVVRKWLVAPESRMAHRLMVAALSLIVLSRMKAVSAYLWVGVGQQIVLTEVINLSLLTPAHQKYTGYWLA